MRITVLLQPVKSLEAEQPDLGKDVVEELTRIKHYLWHGSTFQALQRLDGICMELEFPQTPTDRTRKMAR
jgi:hypothetical protein